MKKIIKITTKIVLRTLGAILISVLLFITTLMIMYSPNYILKGILEGAPPGNLDYKKFPVKEIKKSDSAFYFRENINEAYTENLFKDKIRSFRTTTFEEYIEKTNTTALIVIKNDTIIYEKYFNGFQRDDLSMAMSMTKSFVNSLIGIAIDEGFIKSVDEPITNYLPELKNRDPGFEQITLKHLLMMCSGINRHKSTIKGMPLPWDGKAISYGHPKLRKYILERLDINDEAGKRFNYNDFNAELLGLILERSINKTPSEYLEEKIWKPCGMEYPALWTMDSEKSSFEKKSSGLFARPIDYAKYGRLYLKSGNWEGKQIISKEWINESMYESNMENVKDYYPEDWVNNTYYKYHWKGRLNPDSTINLSIGGVMGQNIFIAPHKNLIIVHCGTKHNYYGVEDLWDIERLIDNPFYNILNSAGILPAITYADSLISINQNINLTEKQLNLLGYRYLNDNDLDNAIAVFELYVRAYPLSSNAYDSLGEAYMKAGQKNLAIQNYKKSLKLNPNNNNAKLMLDNLKNQ